MYSAEKHDLVTKDLYVKEFFMLRNVCLQEQFVLNSKTYWMLVKLVTHQTTDKTLTMGMSTDYHHHHMVMKSHRFDKLMIVQLVSNLIYQHLTNKKWPSGQNPAHTIGRAVTTSNWSLVFFCQQAQGWTYIYSQVESARKMRKSLTDVDNPLASTSEYI